jgi:uncharacterized repeat protein (TIGR03806 family)
MTIDARYMLLCCLVQSFLWPAFASGQSKPSDVRLRERIPWQNNRLVGSPDPPLPYATEPAFDAIDWDRPIYAKSEPGTNNLLVVLQGGEQDRPSRILRLDETQPDRISELLEIDRRIVYGLAFDPDYESNGFIYLFTNGPTGEPERSNQISRFKVGRSGNRHCDPTSELVVIQWRSMGHDGGELGFGNDDMLYISSGDGTTDSDRWLSAQDVSNLLGGVLRIDVRSATADSPYKIPTDNPFVNMDGARGEWWAFGLRNPWRLWCDRPSGQIWVGNNGQDLWESIHLIRRGENYGWSVYEGSHPFYPQRERGPASIVPPTIEHHHTEARSLTGGILYRGSRHPELDGVYLYGDYSTGRIWGVRHDGSRVTWHRELADTVHQIAGFAMTPSGSIIVVDHGGSLHRLTKAKVVETANEFPVRLSETGLFSSLQEHSLSPGILPYRVNAPAWNDGAEAERFLAVPGVERAEINGNRGWNFPNGSVLVQTLSLPDGDSRKRIETRLLLRQQNEWAGYSYRWNDEQTDATLVPKSGEDIDVALTDGTTTNWHIPSRAECLSCHSRAVNFVLGLSNLQLNRSYDDHGETENQLASFERIGLIEQAPNEEGPKLVNPYDSALPLEARARSYLHVNCSSCHVEAGGGNARMELEFTRSLDETQLVSRPQHATFNIANAMLVAPGHPEQSVLLARVSRRGRGQMPPLFTRVVDRAGIDILTDWIRSLPSSDRKFVREWKVDELLDRMNDASGDRSWQRGKQLYRDLGCLQCHRRDQEGGGAGPDLTGISDRRAAKQVIESILDPSASIEPQYAMTLVITVDGRVFSGRIDFEDAETIHLRSPESFDQAVQIKKADIEEQRPAKLSMMPAGMLNTCTADEVLDLLEYILTANSAVDTGAAR